MASTKAQKLEVAQKMLEYLNTGDDAICNEVMASDFETVIPGTGGKPFKANPGPEGIEGSTSSGDT
jgi:hypothetical protein